MGEFRLAPRPLRLDFKASAHQSTGMELNRQDKLILDRWHRMQGKTPIPKKRGAPEGNQNRLKHGIFASKCLNPDEKQMFDVIIEQLHLDFQFNKSSDFLQVELIGVYSVKLVRAQVAGNIEAAEKFDRMIRCHMKDLKTTKFAREGETTRAPETTPAEWATALLEKMADRPASQGTAQARSQKKPARKSVKGRKTQK